MQLRLSITLGPNMAAGPEIADALTLVAARVLSRGPEISEPRTESNQHNGLIRDTEGNLVGMWEVDE